DRAARREHVPCLRVENGERSAPSAALLRSTSFLDWRSDEIPPLGPGAVVVLHVLEAEQMLHHEPGQARTLADTAARAHRRFARAALRGLHRLQVVEALEGAVLVAVLPPRNALRAGNVPAALAGLGQTGRREDLSSEFLRAADVDQCGLLAGARR